MIFARARPYTIAKNLPDTDDITSDVTNNSIN